MNEEKNKMGLSLPEYIFAYLALPKMVKLTGGLLSLEYVVCAKLGLINKF